MNSLLYSSFFALSRMTLEELLSRIPPMDYHDEFWHDESFYKLKYSIVF